MEAPQGVTASVAENGAGRKGVLLPAGPGIPIRSRSTTTRHRATTTTTTSSIGSRSSSSASRRRQQQQRYNVRKRVLLAQQQRLKQKRTEFVLRLLPYVCLAFLIFVLYDFILDTYFVDDLQSTNQEDVYFGPALGMDYQEHYHPHPSLFQRINTVDDDTHILSPAGTSKDWNTLFFSKGTTDDYDYDDIYNSNGNHPVYDGSSEETTLITQQYTSNDIIANGCDLTVVLLDPRISQTSSFQDGRWYTLESVATYAPYACILLQTSFCNNPKSTNSDKDEQQQQETEINETEQMNRLSSHLYKYSLPLFRQMMIRGQVRISLFNYTKYGFAECENFSNPSKALMNIHYWGSDEFIAEQDSDRVLIIQSDAVLCHNLLIHKWMDVSYVGAPWPKGVDHPFNQPPFGRGEDMCLGLPRRAQTWFLNQKRFAMMTEKLKSLGQAETKRQSEGKQKEATTETVSLLDNPNKGGNPASTSSSLLRGTAGGLMSFRKQKQQQQQSYLSILDPSPIMSNMCSDEKGVSDGSGPIGNGGLSIRSRMWMRHVIQTCPHIHHSGIEFYKDMFDNPLFARPLSEEEEAEPTNNNNKMIVPSFLKNKKITQTKLELERNRVHSLMKVPPTLPKYACKVMDDSYEDVYFATVLRALGAPLPTAYEASLFSLEMLWPETVGGSISGSDDKDNKKESMYGSFTSHELHRFQRRRVDPRTLNKTKSLNVEVEKSSTPNNSNHHVIPLGMHKPWWYHHNNILRQPNGQIETECKFLKYIFRPEDSRWQKQTEE